MSRALEYCREMIRSFFSQNGCWWPLWMSEIHFRLHFSQFQIKTQLSFFLLKMAAGSHFGCPKLFFVCISGHFRSKCNFHFFSQNGSRRPFWMSEIHFRLLFWPFQIKMQLSFFFSKTWFPCTFSIN